MTGIDKNADHNLEKLIDTLCKLPPDDLKEVKRRLEKQLADPKHSREPLDDLHEDDLVGVGFEPRDCGWRGLYEGSAQNHL